MTDSGTGQSTPRPISISGFEDPVEIGRGGFGVVYKAHQTGFERTVALKVLPIAAADESARDRFERERMAMGALSSHPNIVTVYGSGFTDDQQPYIVMEFMSRLARRSAHEARRDAVERRSGRDDQGRGSARRRARGRRAAPRHQAREHPRVAVRRAQARRLRHRAHRGRQPRRAAGSSPRRWRTRRRRSSRASDRPRPPTSTASRPRSTR